jgi:hypothetical protein
MKPMSAEIIQAREFANRLRDCLPKSVDVAALGVMQKAPFNLLCAREALIWRTEELARNACDALERDDFTAAAILVRAITESAALAWKLMELLDDRQRYSTSELGDLLMNVLVSSKKWPDFPQPFNVLTCVDRLDKQVSGVRAAYDNLCEIAHPNWSGTLGMYAMTDKEQFVTHFGRGLRGAESTRRMVTNAMLGSGGLFEFAYNRIADALPAFLAELEPIWPDEKPAQ